MEDYLKKLDEYINLKTKYYGHEISIREQIYLRTARSEMEVALLLLIKYHAVVKNNSLNTI